MPKQVIVMMKENYPFGECEERSAQNLVVLVRKIYQGTQSQRDSLLEKANVIRQLAQDRLIKLESVLEEEDSIHFLFQYVPIKMQNWIMNINDTFVENFRNKLIKFASYLAAQNIRTTFQLKNIGMDYNYGAKYFLGFDFQVDFKCSKQQLQLNYSRQITALFKPYIVLDKTHQLNQPQFKKQKISKQHQQLSNIHQPLVEKKGSISPPTNKITSKHREKALQQYYQQVNMSVDSENEKILQQFMDVLDNDTEEEKKDKKDIKIKKEENKEYIYAREPFNKQIKKEKTTADRTRQIHDRVQAAIFKSTQVIDKFKHLKL